MATALSAKALSNLVCESSVRSSESVLAQELDRNLNDLLNGVLARNQPSEKTDESSKKKVEIDKKKRQGRQKRKTDRQSKRQIRVTCELDSKTDLNDFKNFVQIVLSRLLNGSRVGLY